MPRTCNLSNLTSPLTNLPQKFTNKPVDDVAELQRLYHRLIAVVRSAYAALRSEYGTAAGDLLSTIFPHYYGPGASGAPTAGLGAALLDGSALRALRNLPLHLSAVHFSLWTRLRGEPLPHVGELLHAYRPYAFNPLRALPPFEKHAQLVDGRHAFTFAGAQISFDPAASGCSVVLAHDAINANFTVLAQIGGGADGRLAGITILDGKTGDALQLAPGAVFKVNGAAVDVPLTHGELQAWRDWHTVSAQTTAGVRVTCTLDLRGCAVIVNGFYHGQLRGVLGAASTEPTLDGRLPSGKRATNAGELVNGYATGGKQCAADGEW